MRVNDKLRMAAGSCFATIAVLGFIFLQQAIPAAAGQRPTAQTTSGVNPVHGGLPNHDADAQVWSGRETFPSMQASCVSNPLAPGLGPTSWSSTQDWFQSSAFPMQAVGGPSVMAWYGYGAEPAWWSYAYATANPTLAPCGAFQWGLP